MFKRFSLIPIIIIFLTLSTSAQETDNSTVLARFDHQKVTLGELITAYSKNGIGNGNALKDSVKDLQHFLELYVTYRMKVEDGKDRGFMKDSSIQADVRNYSDQLKLSYYLDKFFIDPNIKRIYNRRKWELRVSHIILIPHFGRDSSKTRKLANAILDSVLHGANFAKMAKKYSDDQYTKNKGGDVYYITAGELPRHLEDVLYSMKTGEIYPEVVKSKFGFHIFKLTDKRKRVPKIRASHILIKYQFNGKPDTARAKAIIDTVYQKLKAGESFEKLAKKYSTDKGSALHGGDIGFFARNQTVRPFDNAAFNLKNIGDYSGIVQTRYGFHIIKLTYKSPYPSFKEDKAKLVKLFKEKQYPVEYKQFTDSLKEKYHFKQNDNLIKYLSGLIDTSKTGFDIKSLPDSIKNETIFSFNNQNVKLSRVISLLEQLSPEENSKITKEPFQQGAKKIANKLIMINDVPKNYEKDSTYISFLNDYRNGAILLKVQQLEVWDKVKSDSVSLFKYYTNNKQKYKWPDRVAFTELYTKKDSLLQHYQKMLKNGANFDTLCYKYTERRGIKKGGKWKLDNKDHNDLYKKAWSIKNVGDITGIIKNYGGYSIIRLDEKDPARIKTFAESRPEVTVDYQNALSKQLENNYLEKLKEKYKPIIYYNKFDNLFRKNK